MTTPALTRPLTGEEYLESLRDGRVIYFDGKRIDDVTTHPAFTNAAYSVARMYDSLHDPAKRAPTSSTRSPNRRRTCSRRVTRSRSGPG